MTTKYKIIFGFLFMVILVGTLAALGWFKLEAASTGFDNYRSEARVTVSANAADALMREAQSKVGRFMSSVDGSLMELARKDLEGSIKYTETARKFETDPRNHTRVDALVNQLKNMSDLTKTVQDKLVGARTLIREKMQPSAARINSDLSKLSDAALAANDVAMVTLLDGAYSAYAEFRVAVRLYEAIHQDEYLAAANKQLLAFESVLKQMEGMGAKGEEAKALLALYQSYTTYATQFKDLETFIKAGLLAQQQMDSTSVSVATFFDSYTTDAQKDMDKWGTDLHASNANAQTSVLTISGLGMVLSLLLAGWIIFSIVRILGQVSTFAKEISNGNFNAQLHVREGGEIGGMVQSILQIPATLSAMAKEYSRLETRVEEGYLDVQGDTSKFSGGFATLVEGTNNILKRMGLIFNNIPSPMVMLNKDLKASYLNSVAQSLAGTDYHGKTCSEMFCREDYGTSTCGLMCAVNTSRISSSETVAHPRGKRLDIRYTAIPMTDAQGKIASVLQFIVDLTQIKDTERKIVEVAKQALENADRVAAASEQLSAQVEQVSRGADMQRARVEETAAAMNEMNATVLEVARSAGHASEQSEDTRKKAENGADLMNKMVKSINGVNTVALGLQNNMEELGKQAESIGNVMNVISDIADQTNLLALNAAIEAARAGEAGRGFAVVADEVRKLAEKTMSATTEVGTNIRAIQNSAHTNIAEVTNAVKNIGEATDLANTSGQALQEIVTLAAASSSVVASIATAAEEQSATSEEINKSLEDVSRVVTETAEGMTQASSAVQDLSETAQQLKRIMEELRTKK